MKVANVSRPYLKLILLPQNPNLKQNPVFSQYESVISALKSCKQTFEISQVHGYMIKSGLDHQTFMLSKLLASSIQDVRYAASIFNHIQHPNLFMYNTMLRCYSVSAKPKQAFGIFNNLRAEGIMLDQFSFITTLKACTNESAIATGQAIHGVVVKSGHILFVDVKNTLTHFYSVCGRILEAHHLFDEKSQRNDLVSWNTLMVGYLRVSKPHTVLTLFRQMCRSGLTVTVSAVLTALPAAGDLRDSVGGESLHGRCIKIGLSSDLKVASALIDMYAKLRNIDSGRRIFDGMVEKDVVLWNSMISSYAKSGLLEDCLALLQLMELGGVKPNSSTLVGLLSASAASGATNLGRCIGNYVDEEGLPLDLVLGTALVDMYAKCGFLDKAIDIFERMESKDVKSWTALISGFGFHGIATNAVALFYRMEEEGFRPNEVTFLAVLSACSHGGLVTEGTKCFEKMVQEYGILPKIEHYGCIIDLLGRAGLLKEAYNLIKSLPIRGDATAWRALLSACRVHGNVGLGECVKRVLDGLGNEHPTDSILLSSTYAIAGRLPDQKRMQAAEEEKILEEAGNSTALKNGGKMIKEAGYSAIEMDNEEGFGLFGGIRSHIV